MSIERPHIYASEKEVPSGVEKRDILEGALRELYFAEHPPIQKGSSEAENEARRLFEGNQLPSVWVHYPWRNIALHVPDETVYHQLHTARNRNLITEVEQSAYRAATVGIAGLSVGSAVLASLVATGGPKKIKIADPDTLEITNLNRIRATLPDVGMNKTDIAAKESWEVDPFLDLDLWPEGIKQETLQKIMNQPRLDVFIDEMDNIAMKVEARKVCKKLKIPVVMATDNGDGAIVDVERFDTEPDRPIFHGRVDLAKCNVNDMDRDSFIQMANEIIDPSLFTKRQWDSIQLVGKDLSGIPQIGTAASIAGAAAAYAVRMIVTKQPLPSGRYIISCEKTFVQ